MFWGVCVGLFVCFELNVGYMRAFGVVLGLSLCFEVRVRLCKCFGVSVCGFVYLFWDV